MRSKPLRVRAAAPDSRTASPFARGSSETFGFRHKAKNNDIGINSSPDRRAESEDNTEAS
jgi:hypothetical protein